MWHTLNDQQKKAVQTTKGRVLVLAGAGSGKTSVLTCRMAHLIHNENVLPDQILGLTFTNKAAQEMRERIEKLIPKKQAKQITLCTFHSFCMHLLRKEIHHLGFTSQFSLYDEKDVKRLLTHIVRHTLEHEGELPSLQTTLQKIQTAKNLGHLVIEEENTISWHAQFSADLLEKLNRCMRSYNAVDFDSLLTLTVQLFQEHPDVLERFQERYRYILIDEYQDTNPIQYKLAQLLSSKYNNLCVVGDDDQSIYGWRGAEIKHILNFPSDFIVKLEQNYRSTPTILQAANQVIANNQERHHKELWSSNEVGDPILVFHAPNEIEEAQSVVQRILWYRKHHRLQWKDFAILYRSNALSSAFETTLIQTAWEDHGIWRRGIPYEVFGGTEFYERAEIKDLFAYLRVIENPLDEEALLRIINTPRRGISDTCLDVLTQHNRANKTPLWNVLLSTQEGDSPFREILSSKALLGIENFLLLIANAQQQFQEKPLHKALEELIQKIDYKKCILEEAKSDKMREFKWENVQHCIQTLARYEEGSTNPSLQDFLSSCLLQSDHLFQTGKKASDDKVHLMTIHSAKGLEFCVCFLVCLEDHIMPHEKSDTKEGLEEERRLMYVAMTRAKKHLILSMAKTRKKMGSQISTTPSRFLFEIPKHLLKIVSHQTIDPT